MDGDINIDRYIDKSTISSKNDAKIIVQQVDASQVNKYDRKYYNTHNHWKDNIKPDDYIKVGSECNTNMWIDIFHSSYSAINVHPSQIYWLLRASAIGETTQKLSSLYREEYDEFIDDMTKKTKNIFEHKTRYFVRSDTVSLKHGKYGIGPYTDFESIILSSITCESTHRPITQNTKHLKYYLLPWIEIDSDREFRVFVKHNKIQAISQQHLYDPNSTLKKCTNQDELNNIIKTWCEKITSYFEKVISKNIHHIDSYCIDIALIDKDNETNIPYFIEINPYGAQYSSGSSLFHWILDDEIFNAEHANDIYFRYTI